MIDVLEQIEFLNSLLSDDTPSHIRSTIQHRIAKLKLDVLAFEQAHMSETDAKILNTSRQKILDF